MTWDEFQEWLVYHASGFTGLHSWLSKMPENRAVARSESEPTQHDVLQRWYRCLDDVDLKDAKRASDSLLSGDEAEPRGYDKHPAAVAAIARRLHGSRPSGAREEGPRFIHGEEVVTCLLCRDWGRFSVWHPESMKRVAAEGLNPPHYVCAVSCTCPAGRRYRKRIRQFEPRLDLPLRRQDSDGVWRLHDVADQEEHAALFEFVGAIVPANREPAFDRYRHGSEV